MKSFLHIKAKKIETIISYFDNHLWNVGIQKKKKQFLKEQYINPNIVFSTPLGDYIHRNNINKRLNAVKKGTDYEYITVHFLRHANATLLIMKDVDFKVVSSHLGHNDIQTTANIYADVLKSKEHQIAQLIEFNLEDDQ